MFKGNQSTQTSKETYEATNEIRESWANASPCNLPLRNVRPKTVADQHTTEQSMKTWLSGFTLAAALLVAAGTAHAQSYTCNESGNPPPASVSGDAIITEPGTCTLTNDVTATGQISITAGSTVNVQDLTTVDNTTITGTDITTGDITSDWGVQVTASSGNISLGDVISNANDSSFGGNVLLTATGNIGTGDITNGGVTTAGGIEIHANTSGSSSVFNIGGGGTNGHDYHAECGWRCCSHGLCNCQR